MKSTSKKHEGFGLMEVVISMAIIAIISIGVYDGFMIIIKQTKAGEVKQEVALEGKKVLEEIKSTNVTIPKDASPLSIGEITLDKQLGSTGVYRRYLDANYNSKDIEEKSRKYTEVITLTHTKAYSNDVAEDVTLNDNQAGVDELKNISNSNYTIYISKKETNNTIKDYINDETQDTPKDLESDSNKIVLYIYLDKTSQGDRTIRIMDFKGNEPFGTAKTMPNRTSEKVSLGINFSNYKPIKTSAVKSVEINVNNSTTDVPNIYMIKNNTLNVDVKALKGEINIYDNRAEETQEANMGTLYDIKVEIKDYMKDLKGEIKEDKDNLFTGYSKQNIE